MKFTLSELKAYEILLKSGNISGYTTNISSINAHEAGNEIIKLARQIESERQVLIMEK